MRTIILLLITALWTQSLPAIESNKTVTASAKNERWELVCTLTENVTLTPELNFYFKCELKNLSKEAMPVNKRARVFVQTENGPVKCLHYMTERKATIPPGGKVTWWQQSIFNQGGKFSLYVQSEQDESLKTEPVKVTFKMVEDQFLIDPLESVSKAFQTRWAGFPKIAPNLDGPAKVHFEAAKFIAEPISVGGRLYYGFVFKAPKEPSKLVWAFAVDNPTPIQWYICRRNGRMAGFQDFESDEISARHKALGLTKGSLIYQSLDAAFFKPEEEYLIYFSTPDGSIDQLVFSVNFSTKQASSFREFFPQYFSR